MKLLTKKLAEITLDPANPRTHNDKSVAAIRASLERFGQQKPVVLDTNGVVRAGNGTVEAARSLGWTTIRVVVSDLPAAEIAAYAIADNRTGELSDWNPEVLAAVLEELRASEAGLAGVGFTGAEVTALLKQVRGAALKDPGPEPPPKIPTSRLGDLWVLAADTDPAAAAFAHRLLCGDSTNPDDVARLMNDETAALLATDPPYLVDYEGTQWDAFDGDDAGVEFFSAFLRVALEHCVERVPIYQWHATRRQAIVERAWVRNGLLVHQTIIWVKTRGVLTRSHYLWSHEPCFYGWREGARPIETRCACPAPPSERTVWDVEQLDSAGVDHPTVKPVEIFARPIRSHTRPGEICLEPFSGGGTQIIAAERLARRCYAMELDPGFVDVAVRRWELTTGCSARLADTGQTFAEVAAERSGGSRSAAAASSLPAAAPVTAPKRARKPKPAKDAARASKPATKRRTRS